MLTYIIRRLLYSVVVLVAASFLVFTFVAKVAGDPLAPLRIAPNVSEETVAERIDRGEAPQRLGLRALRLLGRRTRSRTSSARRSSTTSRSSPTSGA